MRGSRERTGLPPESEAHVGPWLDRYRTGELEEADRRRVEEHLGACAACAGELAGLGAFAATVRRAFDAAQAAGVSREPAWDRQRREILARTAEPRSEGGWRDVLRQYAPQAAMAAVSLIVLGVLYREGVREFADAERELRPGLDEVSEAEFSRAPAEDAKPLSSAAASEGEDDARASRDSGPVGGLQAPLPFRSRAREAMELEDHRAPGGPRAEREPAAPAPAFGDAGRAAGVEGNLAEEADELRAQGQAQDAALPAPPPERQEQDREDRREALAKEPAAKEMQAEAGQAAAQEQANRDEVRMNAGAREPGHEKAAEKAPDDKAANEAPDLLQRLDLYVRRALVSMDSLDVERALAFWRDSVAQREDLDPRRKRAAAASTDSLATRAAQPR
jgi:hypothetical protein